MIEDILQISLNIKSKSGEIPPNNNLRKSILQKKMIFFFWKICNTKIYSSYITQFSTRRLNFYSKIKVSCTWGRLLAPDDGIPILNTIPNHSSILIYSLKINSMAYTLAIGIGGWEIRPFGELQLTIANHCWFPCAKRTRYNGLWWFQIPIVFYWSTKEFQFLNFNSIVCESRSPCSTTPHVNHDGYPCHPCLDQEYGLAI